MSLSVEQIRSYFNFLCTNIYNKSGISFFELNLTSVKGRKVLFDEKNNFTYGKTFELTSFIDNLISKVSPEKRDEILILWEKEVPKAKKMQIIDLGSIEACGKGDGSLNSYRTIAVKAETDPEEIVFLIEAEDTDIFEESENLNDGTSIKSLLSMVVMPKYVELLKVYFKDWTVNKMGVGTSGLHERKQNYNWDEYNKNHYPCIKKEDWDRYYCYTSKVFLSNAEPNDVYKFYYRSKKLSSNGRYYWYSSTIKITAEYFTIYTVDVSDEINKMHLIESRNTRFLDRYKSAIISDAIAFYEFNLTQNKIMGRPLQMIGNKKIPILESVGLSKNCSYTDFIEANSWTMGEEERRIYTEKMDRESLLENFKKGEFEIWFDLARKNYDGQTFWTRSTVILIKDEYTKDVIGLTVVKNISDIHAAEEEQRYQLEVINGLSVEYSNIFLVDREFKGIKPVRLSDNIKGFFRDLIAGAVYTDALELYVETSVYEGDRDMMKQAFSRENILRQLHVRESFYVNYRSYINNKLEYYKLKVVRIGSSSDFKDILFGFVNVDMEIEHEMEQKKLLEEALVAAEAANRAKTRFLSSMSHDIRTPMNAIIGFTTLAVEHLNDPDSIKDYLKKIQHASGHLLSLINDILDMSRIESGRLKIHPVPCTLDEIIANIQDVINPQVAVKNINFKIEEVNVYDRHFICDSLRLNQILINIIGNSVKFTNDGGDITLTIAQLSSFENKSCTFQFKVKDNGIGMSEELQKHIFEPFTREDNPSVEKIQGSGLGMSITKNIVDLMKGEIFVHSKLGVGTETLICLDFQSIEKEELEQSKIKNDEPVDISDFKGKRILLTEDNAFNREIAVTLLKDQGFEVDCAENGKIAVDKISEAEEKYYSLVLMDIMMPVMNGLDAARAIRKLSNPVKASIPIVAMTANAFEEDKKNTREAGMDAYISKPFNMKNLLQILKYLLTR